MKYKSIYVSSLIRELDMRKDYLGGEKIETIYFGGGTPSQLSSADFDRIFNAIYNTFNVSSDSEITLEANPDDLTSSYVSSLCSLPFNRISMGIQSFHNEDLHFLNRRHDREGAIQAVSLCKEKGFENISIDLIYGLPNQTLSAWIDNLEQALSLNVPHVSAYSLIYEESTPLYRLLKSGKIKPVDDDLSLELYSTLIKRLTEAGYQHYEISNFARPGFISRHNSSYWTEKKYLGIGAAAHSYDLQSRQWNVSSLPLYIKGIEEGRLNYEREALTDDMKYNDYIITGLRTCWGIGLDEISEKFGESRLQYCLLMAKPYLESGKLRSENRNFYLTQAGLFVSDSIMTDLLWVN